MADIDADGFFILILYLFFTQLTHEEYIVYRGGTLQTFKKQTQTPPTPKIAICVPHSIVPFGVVESGAAFHSHY